MNPSSGPSAFGSAAPDAPGADLLERWLTILRDRATGGDRPPRDEGRERETLRELVRWIVDAEPGERDLTPSAAEALGGFVVTRRNRGELLEEVLVDLRLLEDVVLEDLQGSASPDDDAEGLLRVARGVSGRMGVVMTLAAGMFNEEVEQERRLERRKLDDFTRMVSHEMRTPIGAAYTAARMLRDMWSELPGEERERMLEIVGRGLSRATHLLESVMSIALARTGGDGPPPTRALRDVVENVVGEARESGARAGVRVEVAGAVPNAPVDARRVQLILHTLLANAVKYADPSKEDRWVRVRVERDKESYGWVVQVDDNGSGIRRDEQEKIFRRFYRAHTDLSEGTGLGLVIAREAAEQLGGEIRVESVPGVGSTFSFVVPDATEEEARAGREPGAEGSLRGG